MSFGAFLDGFMSGAERGQALSERMDRQQYNDRMYRSNTDAINKDDYYEKDASDNPGEDKPKKGKLGQFMDKLSRNKYDGDLAPKKQANLAAEFGAKPQVMARQPQNPSQFESVNAPQVEMQQPVAIEQPQQQQDDQGYIYSPVPARRVLR